MNSVKISISSPLCKEWFVGMAVELSWKVWLSTRERNFQEMRGF